MRIAAGIERQSAGRVLINGKEIAGTQTFVRPKSAVSA
jgi:iron(III) transport system ATP-binding protein